jgi:hypothetical protein
MSEKPNNKDGNGISFDKSIKLAAAAAMLTAAVSGIGAAKGCSSERPQESSVTEIERLLDQEQKIQAENTRYIKDNSELDVYVVKSGDGENDIYYATGWVGQKHAEGDTDQEYDLGEVASVIKSIEGNEEIDFNNLEPGMTVKILIRNSTE